MPTNVTVGTYDVPSDPEDTPLGDPGDSSPARDMPELAQAIGTDLSLLQTAHNAHELLTTGIHGVGAGAVESTAHKGVANGYASLDSGGKIPITQLPALAINDTFVVASQAAMLALTAQRGDVAVRTDLSKSFILTVDAPGTLANWQELLTPPDVVQSVDGMTGTVVLPTDAAAGTGSKRTLGTGALQATAGNDARLSDARTPTAHHTTHEPGGSDALTSYAQVQYDVFHVGGGATWTKPSWAKKVEVHVVAGGSGGGSGRRGAAGTVRCGGGGGAPGSYSWAVFAAADLPGSMTVSCGAGGAGGAAITADSTDGNAGIGGNASAFGATSPRIRAAPNNGGGGGTNAAGTGGVASGGGMLALANGGAASVTGGVGSIGGTSSGPGGGGAGGGITSGDSPSAGGNGGITAQRYNETITAGGAVPGGAGGTDAAAAFTSSVLMGQGGAGGAGSITGAGGAGGAGKFGSGGGGGGASLNGNNSGAGGAGGDGYVVVVSIG